MTAPNQVKITDDGRSFSIPPLAGKETGLSNEEARERLRRDGPNEPEVMAVMAKYTGQPAERLKEAIAYIDPKGRLDLKDMQRQIDWFVSQNLLKGAPKFTDMIDRKTVIPLPAK